MKDAAQSKQVGLRLTQAYLYSAAGILIITGLLKLLGASGSDRILDKIDPILRLTHRQIFIGTGLLELGIAVYILVGKSMPARAAILACLAANFLAYRIVLWQAKIPLPCPCLGRLAVWLKLNQVWVDFSLKCVIAYLLAGSCALLIRENGWWGKAKVIAAK